VTDRLTRARGLEPRKLGAGFSFGAIRMAKGESASARIAERKICRKVSIVMAGSGTREISYSSLHPS